MDNDGVSESRVSCEDSQGSPIAGHIVQLSRYQITFEVYSPFSTIQSSEVLQNFKVHLRDRIAYSGRAIVKNVVHTGSKAVCSAALEDIWQMQFSREDLQGSRINLLFKEHLSEWHKLYVIRPEYKLHLAEMELFFEELRLWLDQLELCIQSTSGVRSEEELAGELGQSILPSINGLFEKFERLAELLEPAVKPAHRVYMRRRLHPLLLCAPFLYRTYSKPLGYAGDYEMVNMIARNRPEGASLYAKVLNLCFVRQQPAEAHRNRLRHLTEHLVRETARVAVQGRSAQIFSVACGPAVEVQKFLREHHLSNRSELTFLDFNDETINHVAGIFSELKTRCSRATRLQFVKRSVHQLLKEAVKTSSSPQTEQYDFVYCAGLFNYLTDTVCRRLIGLLYDWVAPGGLLLITNVDATLNDVRSFRHSMDFLLDWDLIYRRSDEFRSLVPATLKGECSLKSDETGVNLFLEIRKSQHDRD